MGTGTGRDDGATSLEYTGILLVVAALVAAVVGVLSPAARTVATTAACAVESFLGGAAGCAGGGPVGPGTGRGQQLLARADDLADYAGSGQATESLLAEARQAVAAGRLAEADALLDRLALYADLASSEPRGQHLRELFAASAGEYQDLMAEGSIYHDGGAWSRAYFQMADPPGGGVVAMDFFIDSSSSGYFLEGDDRGHADPLRGDVPLDGSRMMLVVDLATGRGQVHVTETCTARGPSLCNEPRPIVFDGSYLSDDTGTRPVIPLLPNDYDVANQFTVTPAEGGFRLEYDALNGITPGGLSVDGTVSVHVGPDGRASIGEDDRDNYPSIGTYYYATPGQTQVVQQREQEGVVCGASPINFC